MKRALKYLLFLLLFPGLLVYKNPGQVKLWFYGLETLSAAGLIIVLFGGGLVTGLLLCRSFTKAPSRVPFEVEEDEDDEDDEMDNEPLPRRKLSREDRDYLS
jgi:hypothetical protein